MERNTTGNNHPGTARLGLGLAALGRPGYINLGHGKDLQHNYNWQQMQAHSHKMLQAAWAAGIRYFDVARSYGDGEVFLGNWLQTTRFTEEVPVCGSKWGYTYTANWQVQAEKHEVKEHSLPVLQRQYQESRQNLGDFLHLYQIHSATLQSGVLQNPPVLSELHRLKQQGLRIGLSVSGGQQGRAIEEALQISFDGELLFQSVQATFNLLETSVAPALQQAANAGLTVIVKEAVANGRLAGRNPEVAPGRQLELLARLSAEKQAGADALALGWVLAQPWADLVLSGAATLPQLQSNLQATEIKFSAEEMEKLQALAEIPATYWQTRKGLAWN